MNIHNLKQYIINNSHLIENLMIESGFKNISYNLSRGEYRASWEEGTNPTSVCINENTLSSKCFSMNVKGDIIILIESKLKISRGKAIKFIANVVDYTDNEDYIKKELPFGGFFNEILNNSDNDFSELISYEEEILKNYLILPSNKFLEEGIKYEVQEKYKIGYDIMTNRIIIPWRNLNGKIVGIMGRLNKSEILEHEYKYLPIIKFPKSKVLFGFYENYNEIYNKKSLMIFETEKGVMKLESQGINNCIAIGGSSLSNYQANNINSMFLDLIIICLDEGLDEEISKQMVKQLKMNTYYKNEVIYVYDRENKYLPKGSKMSPSDLDKNTLNKLILECSVKLKD